MANKITQTSELKLEAGFYDGDTRTIALADPKSDVTAAQIKAVANTIKTTAAIIGDKTGAAFVGFNKAQKVAKKTTQLDLR